MDNHMETHTHTQTPKLPKHSWKRLAHSKYHRQRSESHSSSQGKYEQTMQCHSEKNQLMLTAWSDSPVILRNLALRKM